MIPESYLEKVYAGFLGMNAGIRLGVPVEPTEWTSKKIKLVYGEIKGYLKEYHIFSADDDANGPIYFIRSLYDDAMDRELRPEDVGKAWLNYCREGVGMIWWGGEDVSTEHRAYVNLKNGIPAPDSGSVKQNGIELAEQIGGQIFIDSWGLIFPGQMEKAADYAEMAASVSHDQNGLYGARFMAACIAKAFEEVDVEKVIEAGLEQIPIECTYTKVVKAVKEFHQQNPKDFRACLAYLHREWGYDRYPGICHIIPNAGVCVLAILYGKGNFARTIEIATMCGWDTDCNAGNVGTILGVMTGLNGIPDHYRKPINDCIVTSSVSGYLNIVDIPTFCKELALLGYRFAKISPPPNLSVKRGEVYFDFKLPGSTHGFRTNNRFKTPMIRHNNSVDGGSLEIIIDRLVEGDQSKVYYKPYYRRSDFNDEKYKPVFSPQAYSGQTVRVEFFLDKWQGADIYLTPYVRTTYSETDLFLEKVLLKQGEWDTLQFIIPDTKGEMIDEIGYLIESPSIVTDRAFGALYFREFHIYGDADYWIDLGKVKEEFLSLMPFSHHKGEWIVENNIIKCKCESECFSFTGNYYTRNATIESVLEPKSGESHGILFRAPGIQRWYFAGFDGVGQISLILNDFGFTRLKTISYDWKHDEKYTFRVVCSNQSIEFLINDIIVFKHQDSRFNHGMYGIGSINKGETHIHSFRMKGMQ